jgi:hypothetical protein
MTKDTGVLGCGAGNMEADELNTSILDDVFIIIKKI